MSKVQKKNEKLSIDEKVKILDRRISFFAGVSIGQSAIFLSMVGIIISFKDSGCLFFEFIQNKYILEIIICIEIFILYFISQKCFRYLKTIEKLKGITGKEDFLN